jgi:hypothetical protein
VGSLNSPRLQEEPDSGALKRDLSVPGVEGKSETEIKELVGKGSSRPFTTADEPNTVHRVHRLSLLLLFDLSTQHLNLGCELLWREDTLLDQEADNGFLLDHLMLQQILDCFDRSIVQGLWHICSPQSRIRT